MEAANQLDLDFAAEMPKTEPEPTNEEKYRAWIEKNPHVFEMTARRAMRQYRAGKRRISFKKIVEDLRDECVPTDSDDGYRINNTWTRFLQDDVLAAHPELVARVQTRRRQKETA